MSTPPTARSTELLQKRRAENTGGEKGSQALNCNCNTGQYRAFIILLNFPNDNLTQMAKWFWYHTEHQQQVIVTENDAENW